MKIFLFILFSLVIFIIGVVSLRKILMYKRVFKKVKELYRKFDVIIGYAIKVAPDIISNEEFSRYSEWFYDKAKTDVIFVAVLLYRYGIRLHYSKHDSMLLNCYKAHIDNYNSALGLIIDEIVKYVKIQMQQLKQTDYFDYELACLSLSSAWALENVVQIGCQFPYELGFYINTQLNKLDIRKDFDNL